MWKRPCLKWADVGLLPSSLNAAFTRKSASVSINAECKGSLTDTDRKRNDTKTVQDWVTYIGVLSISLCFVIHYCERPHLIRELFYAQVAVEAGLLDAPSVFICARLWTVALPEEAQNSQRGFKSPRSVAGWYPDGGRSHNAFAWLGLIRHRREIDGQTELIMRKSIKRRGSAGFIRPSCELVPAEERRGEEESGPRCARLLRSAWPLRSRCLLPASTAFTDGLKAANSCQWFNSLTFFLSIILFLRCQVICVR